MAKFGYVLMVLLPLCNTFSLASSRAEQADTTHSEILRKASSKSIVYDYPKALDAGRKALAAANASRDSKEIALAHGQLGLLYWVDGYYYSSMAHLDSAYLLFLALDDSLQAASTQHTKALNYYYMAMNDSAIFYHKKALAIYRSIGNAKLAAKVLSHIALVYHKTGAYDKSIEYILESNKIRDQIDTPLAAYDFRSSNPAFQDSNYYHEELIIHRASLEKAEKTQDTLAIAEAKHNIGVTYYLLEDYEKSLQFFDQANLAYASVGRLPYWNESVRSLRDLGRYDEAQALLNKHREVIETRGTRITLSEIYGLQGDLYFNSGDFERALSSYKRFCDLSAEMNNRLSLTGCYRKLARTYLALNNTELAKDAGLKALTLAKEISAIEAEMDANNILAQIAVQTNDLKAAIAYKEAYALLLKEINAGEASINMVKAQVEYDAFKKNREINMLTLEKDLQVSKVQNMRITIISVILFASLVLLIAVIYYRRNQLKARSNQLLAKKNREISEQAKLLKQQYHEKELLLGETHHRVKNNLQVINSLLSIHALQLSEGDAKNAVKEGQNRVQVMGLIHENLYQKNNFGAIEMSSYFKQLANNIAVSYGYEKNVLINVDSEDLKLDEDTAINLGLITNELLTNSFKYAFNETEAPEISLKLTKNEAGLRLDIKDNGSGSSEIEAGNSYGISLVKELVKHMDGTINFNCSDGTKICLVIKKYKITA